MEFFKNPFPYVEISKEEVVSIVETFIKKGDENV